MIFHRPVLVDKVIEVFQPLADKTIIDGTLGHAGHTLEFLRLKAGHIWGFDLDPNSLKLARERISQAGFSQKVTLLNQNFTDLDTILGSHHIDRILIDCGLNSDQQKSSPAGFSFQGVNPLDMRLNPQTQQLRAADYLNITSEVQLDQDLSRLVQHPLSTQLARALITHRRLHPFATTADLADFMVDFYRQYRLPHTIHPATKIFLLLRLKVNDELENLQQTLTKIKQLAQKGTRVAIITFHSTEDRLVKMFINQNFSSTGLSFKPSHAEIKSNPLSRSAMLRCFET